LFQPVFEADRGFWRRIGAVGRRSGAKAAATSRVKGKPGCARIDQEPARGIEAKKWERKIREKWAAVPLLQPIHPASDKLLAAAIMNKAGSKVEKGKIMLISTLEYVPGKKIVRHLGVVQGSTVRSKHVGRDIMAGLKNIFGGELKG